MVAPGIQVGANEFNSVARKAEGTGGQSASKSRFCGNQGVKMVKGKIFSSQQKETHAF